MLTVKINDKELKELMRRAPRQIAYAMNRTLTGLAQKSQRQIQADIPRQFDVTRPWWGKQQPTGIKILASTRTRKFARVYIEAAWAERQEYGQSRRPDRGRALIVPLYKRSGRSLDKGNSKWKGIKRETWSKATGKGTAYGKYSSARKTAVTKGLRAKKYPYVYDVGGVTFIIRKKGAEPEALFSTEKRTNKSYKKWGFRKTVIRIVRNHARNEFNWQMRQAMRTAK